MASNMEKDEVVFLDKFVNNLRNCKATQGKKLVYFSLADKTHFANFTTIYKKHPSWEDIRKSNPCSNNARKHIPTELRSMECMNF